MTFLPLLQMIMKSVELNNLFGGMQATPSARRKD